MTTVQEKIDNLNQVIQKYIDENDRGFVQGSDEWKAIRGTTIGGSEQATVEGINKYSNVLDLIRSKLGLIPFPDTIFTKWGNMFEEVITMFVEKDRSTKVMGGEAFLRGRFPTQSYSPDGIAVVCYDGEPEIVLFEFKCPFVRKITGVIPAHYRPQIMAGMDTIRLMKRAIFTEAKFRRCKINDIGPSTNYDKLLWPWDRYEPEIPRAYGYILLRFTTKGLNREHKFATSIIESIKSLANLYSIESFQVYGGATSNPISSLFSTTSDPNCIPDLGCCTEALIKQVFTLYSSGILEPIYLPLMYNDDYKTNPFIPLITPYLEDNVIMGILPYKLLTVCYTEEKIEIGYLDKHKKMIDAVVACVEECKANPEMRDNIINRFALDNGIEIEEKIPTGEPPNKAVEKKPNSDLLEKIAAMKAARKL